MTSKLPLVVSALAETPIEELQSGDLIATSALATGAANSGSFLRGDQTWQAGGLFSGLTGPITATSGGATSVAAQTGTGTTFVMSSGPTLGVPTLVSPTVTGGMTVTTTSIGGLTISLNTTHIPTNILSLTADSPNAGNDIFSLQVKATDNASNLVAAGSLVFTGDDSWGLGAFGSRAKLTINQVGSVVGSDRTYLFDSTGLTMAGPTSTAIVWDTNGVAAPAFTTRSAGTKLVIRPAISGSSSDYAMGIDSGTFWSSVPTASEGFKWYAATTVVATLTGVGDLTVTSAGINQTPGSTGQLLVASSAATKSAARFTDSVNYTLEIIRWDGFAGGSGVSVRGTSFTNVMAIGCNGADVLVVNSSNNVGIGTSTFGTNAAHVIAIVNGTAPSSAPAGQIQMWAASGGLSVMNSAGTVTTIDGTGNFFTPGTMMFGGSSPPSASTNQVSICGTTSATASAGGSATLPANPTAFLQINVAGLLRKVPYYPA